MATLVDMEGNALTGVDLTRRLELLASLLRFTTADSLGIDKVTKLLTDSTAATPIQNSVDLLDVKNNDYIITIFSNLAF
jgi:hypothetical protein